MRVQGVVAMNQGLINPHCYSDYNQLSSDQTYGIDQIESHAHHSPFSSGGVTNIRREGILGPPTQVANDNPLRYIARPAGHESGSYAIGSGISESGSGSISTSPGSNASVLLSPGNLVNPFPSASQVITGSVGFPQPSYNSLIHRVPRMSSIADPQGPGMLAAHRPPTIGNPGSPSLGATTRENYTTATPHLNRHPNSPRSHVDNRSYSTVTDTPRSVLPGGVPLSSSSSGPFAQPPTMLTHNYQGQPLPQDRQTPPFKPQEIVQQIITENDGRTVQPSIDAKIEKGFFLSPDRTWTCYRRNYFAVQCSYTLNPYTPNTYLLLARNGKEAKRIQAISISLSAVVDGTGGKAIELIQHTPKRDKGPQNPIQKERLLPVPPGKVPNDPHGYVSNSFGQATTMAPPYLPLQTEGDPAYAAGGHGSSTHQQHTFERVQFKSATANNGKRRAQQQYYNLIAELWVDIRPHEGSDPVWVKVAQRMSESVVVRGRSPSHYQNEGNGNGSRSGNPPPGSGGNAGGHSGYGPGGAGGRSFNTAYPGSMPMGGSTAYGGSGYRPHQYSLDPSPAGSHSVSSSSSLGGGVERMPNEGGLIKEDEDKAMDHGYDGYQYYPGPLIEAGMPPLSSKQTTTNSPAHDPRRVKEEYGSYSHTSHPVWNSGCGRFQGTETSRGFYPHELRTTY